MLYLGHYKHTICKQLYTKNKALKKLFILVQELTEKNTTSAGLHGVTFPTATFATTALLIAFLRIATYPW